MEVKKFNYLYMLEIDILRNSSQKKLGVLRGAFEGFGCPKRQTKTMVPGSGMNVIVKDLLFMLLVPIQMMQNT